MFNLRARQAKISTVVQSQCSRGLPEKNLHLEEIVGKSEALPIGLIFALHKDCKK